MKAILIDDSRVARRLIRGILERLGFQVIEAENGRVGLTQLQRHPHPEVVLVDWNMPEMNGLEFVRAVRRDPVFRALPIVMVTTENEKERIALAFLAGVNEFVMKPFDADAIELKLQLLGIEPPSCPEKSAF